MERLFVVSEHVEFQPQKKNDQETVVAPKPSEMEKLDSSEIQKQLEDEVIIQSEVESEAETDNFQDTEF